MLIAQRYSKLITGFLEAIDAITKEESFAYNMRRVDGRLGGCFVLQKLRG
jgi:hypothetical protein